MGLRLREMTGRIYRLYRNPVSQNAGSLYLLQAARYLFPLVTVPYLVRVLGPANYGLVSFGQGFIAYLTAFVTYGFDWSATRKIAAAQADAVRVSQIASSVWSTKSLLCGIAFLALWLLTESVARLHAVSPLLFILSGTIIGNVLFPTWLYLGMEQMAVITKIYVMMRLVGTIAIFVFVRRRDDYMVFGSIIGLQSILAGVAGVWYSHRQLGMRLQVASWGNILSELREGGALFLSAGAISLYAGGNSFILGLLADNRAVGYYSAAEKLVKIIVSAYDPISQSLFPKFNRLAAISKEKSMLWAGKLLKFTSVFGLLVSISTFCGAKPIAAIVLGPSYVASVLMIRILAALPFLIAVSNVLGVQIMIPFRHDRVLGCIVFAAGLLNIVLALLLVPRLGAAGMATSVLVSETFVTTAYFAFVAYAGLNPLTWNGDKS